MTTDVKRVARSDWSQDRYGVAPYDHGWDDREADLAQAVRHEYSSGKPFWLVQCRTCMVVLNSGHHYNDRTPANKLAEEHNRAEHA